MKLMGDYVPNAILAHLSASCDDPVSYADTCPGKVMWYPAAVYRPCGMNSQNPSD